MNNLKQMIKSKGTVWAAGAYDALSAEQKAAIGRIDPRCILFDQNTVQ